MTAAAPSTSYVGQSLRRREDIKFLTGNGCYVDDIGLPSMLGVKGIGESGSIGAPPTIVHAVLDALAPFGIAHLDMPLTQQKIWAAIRSTRRELPGSDTDHQSPK